MFWDTYLKSDHTLKSETLAILRKSGKVQRFALKMTRESSQLIKLGFNNEPFDRFKKSVYYAFVLFSYHSILQEFPQSPLR